jgi:enamine deaminase RidA (YjgF/YER057c/UK114 family)
MRKVINTDQAPQAIGAYSQAVKVNNLVFYLGRFH